MQTETPQPAIRPEPPAGPSARKQRNNDNKLGKRLIRETGRAIADFNMIEDGDKVMVCLSGGKDSYSLLDILLTLKARAPINFDIIAVNLDQKQPGFPDHVLPDYLTALGIPFHIETRDTYSIVTRVIAEGKTMCSLCSRLRRGILYRVASELGATKIALGHHRDDILGTFFLNLFYGGRMKAMPPKLMSDDGKHIVIRPLAYIAEKDLVAYAQLKQFPIIPCNLCGSQENLKRKEVSRMIAEWDKNFPGRSWNVFGALSRVVPTHLMDKQLFDFAGLEPTGIADANGDTAFDALPVQQAGEAGFPGIDPDDGEPTPENALLSRGVPAPESRMPDEHEGLGQGQPRNGHSPGLTAPVSGGKPDSQDSPRPAGQKIVFMADLRNTGK